MSESDQIKEQIRFNTEILKLAVLLVLTSLGGAITLLVGDVNTGTEVFFISSGIILGAAGLVQAYNRYRDTRKLIRYGKV